MSKPFVPMVIVAPAIAGEATYTKSTLENLINSLSKNTFDVAELLYKVRVKGFYAEWGFTTFKEYTNTLKIKPRKAQYLTRIVGVMEELGIERTKYEPLGIARLRVITSLDPKDKWTDPETKEVTAHGDFIKLFVEQGDALELEDVDKHVRTLKGFVGDNDLTWLNIQLKRSVLEKVVRPALELAKAHIGSVSKDDEGVSQDASDGAALEVLGIEFMNDPKNELGAYAPEEDEDDTEDAS